MLAHQYQCILAKIGFPEQTEGNHIDARGFIIQQMEVCWKQSCFFGYCNSQMVETDVSHSFVFPSGIIVRGALVTFGTEPQAGINAIIEVCHVVERISHGRMGRQTLRGPIYSYLGIANRENNASSHTR